MGTENAGTEEREAGKNPGLVTGKSRVGRCQIKNQAGGRQDNGAKKSAVWRDGDDSAACSPLCRYRVVKLQASRARFLKTWILAANYRKRGKQLVHGISENGRRRRHH